jgi:hypothetical protein
VSHGTGGTLVFPRMLGWRNVPNGSQACLNACIDSGADTVLVLSVLRAFSDDMEQARRRVAAGGDPATGRIWGMPRVWLDSWLGDTAL